MQAELRHAFPFIPEGIHVAFAHFQKPFLFLARIRLVAGLICYLFVVSQTDNLDPRLHVGAVQILIYGSFGTFLLRRSIEDGRARLLGVLYYLIGNNYIPLALSAAYFASESPWARTTITVLAGTNLEAFVILFFWLFVAVFPTANVPHRVLRPIAFGAAASLGIGFFFIGLGGMRIYRRLSGKPLPHLIDSLSELFFMLWALGAPLIIAASLVLLWKFRLLRESDRQRSLLAFLAISIAFGLPMLTSHLRSLSPAFRLQPDTVDVLYFVINATWALFPMAFTYVVLAQRVLDVEKIASGALRYLLTRYSALTFAFLPLALLSYFGWLNRHSTLAELFEGSSAIVIVALGGLGIAALVYHRTWLDYIDRRFFSERYNSRRVLTELVEQVRGTRNLVELAKLVERGVDLALHLERVALMVEDPAVGRFVDPRHQVRPLDPGSQLITLVSGSRDPIAVDLEAPSSPFRSLPEDDKLWLLENRVEMIAPAHSLDGNLIAVLVLGAKKSELPFLLEDRELLAGVCSSAGLVVELLRLKETSSPVASPPSLNERFEATAAVEADGNDGGNAEAAMECIACDRVFPPGTAECPHCFVDTEKTNAPYILRDLYRLDHRLGAGGMAVVYRAKDLKLGRTVAIKTLPRVNAEAAMRLRREARTAASVTHPGLAAIYGLETWRGVPMIITEYLAGGTLADQLGQDPLDPLAAIDMASTVAQALAKIHTAGILHRDIKPSNIGYTEDGDVKLLDFGIARIQHDFRKERPDDENTAPGPDGSRIVNTASLMLPRTRTGQLVGTVTYLSPEAARGEKADTGVDLWALAVCLYESLTAENLFYGRNFQDVLGKIRDQRIADVRQKAPTCPEPLALFLAEELHLDRSRRSEDGLEMASRLRIVRAKILA